MKKTKKEHACFEKKGERMQPPKNPGSPPPIPTGPQPARRMPQTPPQNNAGRSEGNVSQGMPPRPAMPPLPQSGSFHQPRPQKLQKPTRPQKLPKMPKSQKVAREKKWREPISKERLVDVSLWVLVALLFVSLLFMVIVYFSV